MRMVVATPAEIATFPEAIEVSDGAENESVRLPTVPVILRSANVATPEPFVVAVTVPPSVPAPEEMLAVTWMPEVASGLPAASCT